MQTTSLTEEAIGWLEKRGLDVEVANRCGVASAVPSRPTKHCWVAFPHTLDGAVVHWTARVISEPKPDAWSFQQKGGRRCLWNQDIVRDRTLRSQAPLIITEGHLDALAFMSVGFQAVTSIPDGAPGKPSEDDPLPKAKYAYLADIRDDVQAWPSVILATDADGPGRALFDDLSRIIGRSHCRVIEYPGGAKDANQALIEHGPEALVAAVESARWYHIGGIYELDTLPPMDLAPALRCGISGVDQHWRFRSGEMSVLTGVPTFGKTTLANQIGAMMAKNHGWVVAWCSPEQHPQIHVDRLLHVYMGKTRDRASEQEIEEARHWLRGHSIWFGEEGDDEMTIDWFEERLATAAWRHNVGLVVLDPWNQMVHTRSEFLGLHEYTGETLRRLHRRCRESGVHLMINVHPTKPQNNREGDKAKPPGGYAISDSSHFFNRPDLGATVHRYADHTEFWCWKARYQDGKWYDNGKTGKTKLQFSSDSARFTAQEAVAVDDAGFRR